jgi:hypothetical protein
LVREHVAHSDDLGPVFGCFGLEQVLAYLSNEPRDRCSRRRRRCSRASSRCWESLRRRVVIAPPRRLARSGRHVA